MRILLTGGTGFVGRHLALELLRAGHELTILTRNAEVAQENFPYPAKFFSWKPTEDKVPKEAWSKVDGVIHLAGEGIAEKRWSEEQKRRIRDSRVLGTKNLVDSMLEQKTTKLKFLVSASAVGYYGLKGGDTIFSEDSPAGNDFLAEVCKNWEKEALRAEAAKIRTVRMRLGVVLGRESGMIAKILPLAKPGLAGALGSGKQWMSWIHIQDLVRMLRFAADEEKISGAYNAVAPEPVRNLDFMRVFAGTLSSSVGLPAPKFALQLALGEMSEFLLASLRVIPTRIEKSGFSYRFAKLDAALIDLVGDLGSDTEYYAEQWVPKKVEEVFPFFSDEMNLEILTPPWLNFKVEKKSTKVMATGTLIDYSLRVHGVPVRWRSQIDAWEPNRKFTDFQVKGPYTKWHHTHRFEALAGGTLLSDRVLYQVPMGFLGKLTAGYFVGKDVGEIFGFRKKKIREIFG